MKKKTLEYNHDHPDEYFEKSIGILRENGYTPIAASYFFFEEVYVFETSEEANRAFEQLEREEGKIYAWWYGKSEWLAFVRKQEHEKNCKMRIYSLK